jgi:tetratricopeptide (TPR) repeat protein
MALNSLGVTQKRAGDFAAAIKLYEEGLGIARRIGDRSTERVCLGNLATSYGKVGRLREMQQSAEDALQIAREIGDKVGAGNQLGILGNACVARKDPEQAIRFYQEALELFRAAGARRQEALTLDNIASTLANQGKFKEALGWFKMAAEVGAATFAPQENFMLALQRKIAAAASAAG